MEVNREIDSAGHRLPVTKVALSVICDSVKGLCVVSLLDVLSWLGAGDVFTQAYSFLTTYSCVLFGLYSPLVCDIE